MTQPSKNLKNIQTSSSQIFNSKIFKVATSPRLSGMFQKQQYFNARSPPFRDRKKTDMIERKSETENSKKINDYIRKIIFDNQELGRKIKEIEQINASLIKQNNQLKWREGQTKQYLKELRLKYDVMVSETETSIPEKCNQIISSGRDAFLTLLRGFQYNSLPILRPHETNSQTISKLFLKSSDIIPTKQFEVNQCKKNPFQTFKRSISICIQKQQAETQTQSQANFQQPSSLSLQSQNQSLLQKIRESEQTIKSLQAKNKQIVAKYEKIKTIIGGINHRKQ